jgi:hypothetical protein
MRSTSDRSLGWPPTNDGDETIVEVEVALLFLVLMLISQPEIVRHIIPKEEDRAR